MLSKSAAPCRIKVVWFSDSWECWGKPMDVYVYIYMHICVYIWCVCFFVPNISTNQRSVHYALVYKDGRQPQTSKLIFKAMDDNRILDTFFLCSQGYVPRCLDKLGFGGEVLPVVRLDLLGGLLIFTHHDTQSMFLLYMYNTFDHKLFFKWCTHDYPICHRCWLTECCLPNQYEWTEGGTCMWKHAS